MGISSVFLLLLAWYHHHAMLFLVGIPPRRTPGRSGWSKIVGHAPGREQDGASSLSCEVTGKRLRHEYLHQFRAGLDPRGAWSLAQRE
jgi:hypothetical protein